MAQATIEFLGGFSSTQPHPGSLLTPKPFKNRTGEERDALIHIAVAQVLPDESGLHDADNRGGDTSQAGLEKLEQWASAAAAKGADVVVFPEYFLSGATHELWRRVREAQREQAADDSDDKPAAEEEPESHEKEWIQVIVHVAVKYDIDIVAGTVVELGTQPHEEFLADHPVSSSIDSPTEPSQRDKIPHRLKNKVEAADAQDDNEDALFNTSYYISRAGCVLHRYTKQNLWHPERKTLLHSQTHTHPEQHHGPSTFIIETKRGTKLRAGMAICWDLAWYSRFYQMLSPPYSATSISDLDRDGQVAGPDVIFAPTCWYASDGGAKAFLWNRTGEAQMLDTLCLARAVECECILVMCNVAGPHLDDQSIHKVRRELSSQLQKGANDDELKMPLIGLGRSCVCAPFLNMVQQVPDQREVMMLQTVDLNLLSDAREVYRMRYDHAQR